MDEGIALFVLLNSWAIAVLSPTTQLDRSYLPPGNRKLTPIHPGEILLEEFIRPMGLSQNRIAMDMRVPPRRINEIVQAKRRITPDTALRLALYFNMSPQFWLGLQMDYDLDVAEDELSERIGQEVCVLVQPA